jgi:hypothetical protein
MSGLPAISEAVLPRAVREGTAKDKEAYQAALGFERLLLTQLVDTMTAGQPALSEGPHGSLVKDALADALVSQGGLGLAAQIHSSIASEVGK